MKIAFKKRHLNLNLFYGLFYILAGVMTFKSNQQWWYAIFYILVPLLFIFKYFLLKHKKYVVIDKGFIQVNSLFSKRIQISEIIDIEKYAGKYTIKTDTKKLSIDTSLIEKEALVLLNATLENLNIEWV
jgi:hypothetical protein